MILYQSWLRDRNFYSHLTASIFQAFYNCKNSHSVPSIGKPRFNYIKLTRTFVVHWNNLSFMCFFLPNLNRYCIISSAVEAGDNMVECSCCSPKSGRAKPRNTVTGKEKRKKNTTTKARSFHVAFDTVILPKPEYQTGKLNTELEPRRSVDVKRYEERKARKEIGRKFCSIDWINIPCPNRDKQDREMK